MAYPFDAKGDRFENDGAPRNSIKKAGRETGQARLGAARPDGAGTLHFEALEKRLLLSADLSFVGAANAAFTLDYNEAAEQFRLLDESGATTSQVAATTALADGVLVVGADADGQTLTIARTVADALAETLDPAAAVQFVAAGSQGTVDATDFTGRLIVSETLSETVLMSADSAGLTIVGLDTEDRLELAGTRFSDAITVDATGSGTTVTLGRDGAGALTLSSGQSGPTIAIASGAGDDRITVTGTPDLEIDTGAGLDTVILPASVGEARLVGGTLIFDDGTEVVHDAGDTILVEGTATEAQVGAAHDGFLRLLAPTVLDGPSRLAELETALLSDSRFDEAVPLSGIDFGDWVAPGQKRLGTLTNDTLLAALPVDGGFAYGRLILETDNGIERFVDLSEGAIRDVTRKQTGALTVGDLIVAVNRPGGILTIAIDESATGFTFGSTSVRMSVLQNALARQLGLIDALRTSPNNDPFSAKGRPLVQSIAAQLQTRVEADGDLGTPTTLDALNEILADYARDAASDFSNARPVGGAFATGGDGYGLTLAARAVREITVQGTTVLETSAIRFELSATNAGAIDLADAPELLERGLKFDAGTTIDMTGRLGLALHWTEAGSFTLVEAAATVDALSAPGAGAGLRAGAVPMTLGADGLTAEVSLGASLGSKVSLGSTPDTTDALHFETRALDVALPVTADAAHFAAGTDLSPLNGVVSLGGPIQAGGDLFGTAAPVYVDMPDALTAASKLGASDMAGLFSAFAASIRSFEGGEGLAQTLPFLQDADLAELTLGEASQLGDEADRLARALRNEVVDVVVAPSEGFRLALDFSEWRAFNATFSTDVILNDASAQDIVDALAASSDRLSARDFIVRDLSARPDGGPSFSLEFTGQFEGVPMLTALSASVLSVVGSGSSTITRINQGGIFADLAGLAQDLQAATGATATPRFGFSWDADTGRGGITLPLSLSVTSSTELNLTLAEDDVPEPLANVEITTAGQEVFVTPAITSTLDLNLGFELGTALPAQGGAPIAQTLQDLNPDSAGAVRLSENGRFDLDRAAAFTLVVEGSLGTGLVASGTGTQLRLTGFGAQAAAYVGQSLIAGSQSFTITDATLDGTTLVATLDAPASLTAGSTVEIRGQAPFDITLP